jgi:hypothetical protein
MHALWMLKLSLLIEIKRDSDTHSVRKCLAEVSSSAPHCSRPVPVEETLTSYTSHSKVSNTYGTTVVPYLATHYFSSLWNRGTSAPYCSRPVTVEETLTSYTSHSKVSNTYGTTVVPYVATHYFSSLWNRGTSAPHCSYVLIHAEETLA